ncbi:MAG: S8 family serine peptidase [candidate division WOR-3 bacterium]
MRRLSLILVVLLITTGSAAPIEPLLLEKMSTAGSSEYLPVVIALKEQFNAEAVIRTVKVKDERWRITVSGLKELADRTQGPLLAELNKLADAGKARNVIPLWIVNAVYCELVPAAILSVAELPGVWFVQWDLIPTENALGMAPKEAVADVTGGTDSREWHVRKVKADSVWYVYGYTGQGVVIGNIDTGCDYNHSDLAGHMWTDPNYPYHGWDFENNDNDPMDQNGHGTHTCGINAGDGTGGDTTGMAPRALIMTCRTKTSLSQPLPDTIAENTVFQAMQFCVAPPLSPENHAHVLSMSLGWQHSWNPRRALWRQAVTNVAAAGLPYFIAAGNEGSSNPPDNVRTPGDVPGPWKHPAEMAGGLGGAISIGATDSSDNYAYFTSWGPVSWSTVPPYNDYAYPPGLLKPDFSAPGVDVVSCRLGGGYIAMSGTSMATPCAAGIAALMLEKNPTLLPEEVDSIMQYSVVPRGTPPKNNTYGTGRIDALLCIQNTPLPFGVRLYRAIIDDSAGGNNDQIINPGETINLPVWVKNQCSYTTSGVTGTLRTTDTAHITLLDSVKSFGTIPAGDTAFSGDPGFRFQVAPTCTNNYTLSFELAVRDDQDSLWLSPLKLKVGTPVLGGDSVYAYDGGNGKLDPGEECDIAVQLVNSGLGNAYDVRVVLISADTRLEVLDSSASYGFIPADSWVMNEADHFRVRASATIPREFVIPCSLRISQAGYPDRTVYFGIQVGRLTAIDPIPDGPREPALYYAYDDIDTEYSEHPTFAWVEIRNLGTRLTLNDDQTVQISLPAGFGPIKFYGQRYTQISLCSNGWVAPGYATQTTWLNTALPNSSMPPMFCLKWDDLYPPTGNGVWYYHDPANHRFIIEWDSVHYFNPRDSWDKMQIIFYDTTLAAADGNTEVVYQYLTANRNSSMTIGEQDPTVSIAIQVVFDNNYHRAAAPIVPGRAIKFTTDAPTVGLAEGQNQPQPVLAGVTLLPTAFRNRLTINLILNQETGVKLAVYDRAGRRVRTLLNQRLKPDRYQFTWDGRDDAGRTVGQGVYLIRIETDNQTKTTKAVYLR